MNTPHFKDITKVWYSCSMYLTLELKQAAGGCKNFPEQRNLHEPIEKSQKTTEMETTWRADLESRMKHVLAPSG
jgi:hypothetical protein